MKTWQKFENNVRTLASYIWNCDATTETFSGVKLDCVLKPEHDYWILVEITENNTVEKVRIDIAKFAVCKPALMSKGIYSKSYLVTKNTPTDPMVNAGKETML